MELTYYHACSASEIAQRLEEAEATVRSRLRLARQRLAHCLVRQDWYRRRLQAPPTSGNRRRPCPHSACRGGDLHHTFDQSAPWRNYALEAENATPVPMGSSCGAATIRGGNRCSWFSGFYAPTNREKLRHVECAIASEGGQPEMIGGRAIQPHSSPPSQGMGDFWDA